MSNVSLLVILDGFGHRLETEHNAIALASTPTWDRFIAQRPHTLISGLVSMWACRQGKWVTQKSGI